MDQLAFRGSSILVCVLASGNKWLFPRDEREGRNITIVMQGTVVETPWTADGCDDFERWMSAFSRRCIRQIVLRCRITELSPNSSKVVVLDSYF